MQKSEIYKELVENHNETIPDFVFITNEYLYFARGETVAISILPQSIEFNK